MTPTLTSRESFVFACTSLAARCDRRGLAAQASTFLQIAALAISSPQDEPPIHHYAPDLIEATYHAYGVVGVAASLRRALAAPFEGGFKYGAPQWTGVDE